MGRSAIVIELIDNPAQPIFINLAASIVREIERGRLNPGDRLPGTRALAATLSLHRNTIDAAYQELILQGWLAAEASRGTYVARDLPDLGVCGWNESEAAPISPLRPSATPAPLRFSDGAPDARLMPGAELARAFRRAVSAAGLRMLTGYGDPRGAPPLRASLARYLTAERGLTAGADDVLVTRGSQMALFLAAGAVLEPGQAIAVEDPGYPLAWQAFRAAGARVVGAPVDGQGLNVDRLEALLARDPEIRAVYVTPHHQYPTTVTLGAGRRLRLLDLARRHGLTLIEDDYDHEYRFEGRPVLPLASRAQAENRVVHIGSVSKLLAPALRIGYATGPRPILARMARLREAVDRQGDVPLEHALAKLIDEGDLGRHARKARRIYEQRRDLLATEIAQALGDVATFERPAGGLALWLKVNASIDAAAWAAAAEKAGLMLTYGGQLQLDPAQRLNAFRLGFASLDDDELRRAVKRLAATKPAP
ncbi:MULTISPECIES: MocR-like pyridoxine biosynthesis transcription factor PdxR [Brevundimonas]|jgi:GntR family transcriptional regulator/MocR family aminotransferase|uniref:MocR-like pyridoxine biosynthesis transcription factor PdxR n=1 Tax=Brevundimonas TaxID=41275 RepID=UPI001905F00C|nr:MULTISPECIES: PLP-dependent aminotransferase family protein [Brevundimonas]MBK1970305.1 PLP-dependent aminotransferase family protein [Brevundimonas diminuta]MBK1975852.1 PLP-dependent aminotransferase family protein [Brevundimonas diminuta]MDM8353857.1 PLP-dependent aminotransferase family protein [Brevundimonas diminuta]